MMHLICKPDCFVSIYMDGLRVPYTISERNKENKTKRTGKKLIAWWKNIPLS